MRIRELQLRARLYASSSSIICRRCIPNTYSIGGQRDRSSSIDNYVAIYVATRDSRTRNRSQTSDLAKRLTITTTSASWRGAPICPTPRNCLIGPRYYMSAVPPFYILHKDMIHFYPSTICSVSRDLDLSLSIVEVFGNIKDSIIWLTSHTVSGVGYIVILRSATARYRAWGGNAITIFFIASIRTRRSRWCWSFNKYSSGSIVPNIIDHILLLVSSQSDTANRSVTDIAIGNK